MPQLTPGTRYAWYARLWRDDRLLVVYDDLEAVVPMRCGLLPLAPVMPRGLA